MRNDNCRYELLPFVVNVIGKGYIGTSMYIFFVSFVCYASINNFRSLIFHIHSYQCRVMLVLGVFYCQFPLLILSQLSTKTLECKRCISTLNNFDNFFKKKSTTC